MNRADQKVLNALASLKGNADWNVFSEWMKESSKAELESLLVTKDETTMRWLQGSINTLYSIIELSESAQGILHAKRVQQ